MAHNLPPCVVVERLPFGSSSFTFCHVDEFTAGELTVTATETDRVMEVFKPGTWLTATQYDSHGWSVYSFTSEEASRRAIAARDALRDLVAKYEGKRSA